MFLGKEYDNLFLLDIVCHGVHSPKLWRKYTEFQEEKFGKKLVKVNFRCFYEIIVLDRLAMNVMPNIIRDQI